MEHLELNCGFSRCNFQAKHMMQKIGGRVELACERHSWWMLDLMGGHDGTTLTQFVRLTTLHGLPEEEQLELVRQARAAGRPVRRSK